MADEEPVEDPTLEAAVSAVVNEVEITVAGHTVVVKSADALQDVASWAISLFTQTADAARRIPVGFDTSGGSSELAGPLVEPSALEGEEDDDVRRLGRVHP